MALKTLNFNSHRRLHTPHSVRFRNLDDEHTPFKSLESPGTSLVGQTSGPQSYQSPDSGAPSTHLAPGFIQPAAQRYRINEQSFPKYIEKIYHWQESPGTSLVGQTSGPQSYESPDSGAPSSDLVLGFIQPAAQRYRINEQSFAKYIEKLYHWQERESPGTSLVGQTSGPQSYESPDSGAPSSDLALGFIQPAAQRYRINEQSFAKYIEKLYHWQESPGTSLVVQTSGPQSYQSPDSGAPSSDLALGFIQPAAQRYRINEQSFAKYIDKQYHCQESPETSLVGLTSGPQSYQAPDSGAPSPDLAPAFMQPAAQRYRINEQRIKLITAINQIVQQRAELESNRTTLSNLLDELKRKLKRKIEECHHDKKEKVKSLKQNNAKLEKERAAIVHEIDHLRRHLEKEEAHHVQHARAVAAKAIHGHVTGNKTASHDQLFLPGSISVANIPNVVSRNVAKNAPSRAADSKLQAARLMREIAELRQRVAQIEGRLAHEVQRKKQVEMDILRLRKQLSSTKSDIASLRLPLQPLRKPCSHFA